MSENLKIVDAEERKKQHADVLLSVWDKLLFLEHSCRGISLGLDYNAGKFAVSEAAWNGLADTVRDVRNDLDSIMDYLT